MRKISIKKIALLALIFKVALVALLLVKIAQYVPNIESTEVVINQSNFKT